MYTYDIRSVVGVYTPVGVATEWLWSVPSKLECILRQGKGWYCLVTKKTKAKGTKPLKFTTFTRTHIKQELPVVHIDRYHS